MLEATIKKSLVGFEARDIWVGLSGGADSVALLHSLSLVPNLNLRAIHVNHNLSANSAIWQDYCQRLCDQLNIPLEVVKVQLTDTSGGLEFQARKVRFRAFFQHVKPGQVLCLGHHLNDQVETFMARLIKGHGILSLSGIQSSRIDTGRILLRPFLSLSKIHINDHVKCHDLTHVTDESNFNNKFERNWLRNKVIPLISQRCPAFCRNIINLQNKLRQSEYLNYQLALIDILSCEDNNRLSIERLQQLPYERQQNCLEYWLRSKVSLIPDFKNLTDFLLQLQSYQPDSRNECIGFNYKIKVYSGYIYLVYPEIRLLPQKLEFDEKLMCVLSSGIKLQAVASPGFGLVNLDNLMVVPNEKYVKVKLSQRSGTRNVFDLYHEIKVPPWRRNNYPVIIQHDELVYLPNIGPVEQAQIKPNGWLINIVNED